MLSSLNKQIYEVIIFGMLAFAQKSKQETGNIRLSTWSNQQTSGRKEKGQLCQEMVLQT
jgi:hypothetical protein